MDEVALVAEVSKVTIYKHFSDKHSLFVAVVTDAIDDAKAGSQALVDQLGSSTDVERDLRDFARQHVALVTQPHLIQMRRMIIAEAHRFPDLARAWHRIGPERAHATLASRSTSSSSEVCSTCVRLAARRPVAELLDLVGALNEAMFTGRDLPYSRRYAEPLRRRSRTCLPGRLRAGPERAPHYDPARRGHSVPKHHGVVVAQALPTVVASGGASHWLNILAVQPGG